MRLRSVLAGLLLAALFLAAPVQAAGEGGVLILDPGHGGEDGGAVSVDGTPEAALNWEIASRCRDLTWFLGLPVVMTRDDYDINYPQEAETTRQRKAADQKSRLALVNSQENGILLSIHQNQFTASSVSGPQVFYNPKNGAQDLAERLQSLLNAQLAPESRRVAAPIPEEILLTRESSHPAVLVECGFLSNASEAALLRTPDYQLQLSLILIGGYLQHIHLNPEDMDEGE